MAWRAPCPALLSMRACPRAPGRLFSRAAPSPLPSLQAIFGLMNRAISSVHCGAEYRWGCAHTPPDQQAALPAAWAGSSLALAPSAPAHHLRPSSASVGACPCFPHSGRRPFPTQPGHLQEPARDLQLGVGRLWAAWPRRLPGHVRPHAHPHLVRHPSSGGGVRRHAHPGADGSGGGVLLWAQPERAAGHRHPDGRAGAAAHHRPPGPVLCGCMSGCCLHAQGPAVLALRRQ